MTSGINRSWREIKIMLKWRFSALTDADLAFDEDNKEKMLEGLAVKLNKTRSELDLLFSELQKY